MSTSASQVITDYKVELVKHLPLENELFFAMVERDGLFPLEIGDDIKAKDTRAKKVSCFLDFIRPGADTYLPKLLKVMKESGVDDVLELAENIDTTIRNSGESTGLARTGIIVYKNLMMQKSTMSVQIIPS